MKAIEAYFDGQRIVLPERIDRMAPGKVLVVFNNGSERDSETSDWLKAQESAFTQRWDNPDDEIYDTL